MPVTRQCAASWRCPHPLDASTQPRATTCRAFRPSTSSRTPSILSRHRPKERWSHCEWLLSARIRSRAVYLIRTSIRVFDRFEPIERIEKSISYGLSIPLESPTPAASTISFPGRATAFPRPGVARTRPRAAFTRRPTLFGRIPITCHGARSRLTSSPRPARRSVCPSPVLPQSHAVHEHGTGARSPEG